MTTRTLVFGIVPCPNTTANLEKHGLPGAEYRHAHDIETIRAAIGQNPGRVVVGIGEVNTRMALELSHTAEAPYFELVTNCVPGVLPVLNAVTPPAADKQ